jgi:hypothetical protein
MPLLTELKCFFSMDIGYKYFVPLALAKGQAVHTDAN